MLAQWLRERDERKRKEAVRLVEEWRAWYGRMQAAKEEGRPFDEPPPMAAKDKKGK